MLNRTSGGLEAESGASILVPALEHSGDETRHQTDKQNKINSFLTNTTKRKFAADKLDQSCPLAKEIFELAGPRMFAIRLR